MSAYTKLCDTLKRDPKRWLVTGAAGFIGSALSEELLKLDQKVVGLDNFLTGHQRNLDDVTRGIGDRKANFTFIEGDIRKVEDCAKAAKDADYVLHQAALGSVPRSIEDPQASHASNVDGFLNMILAARDANVQRFIYASSSSVYGDHPDLPKVEGNIGRQLSPYAITKRIDELYAGVTQDSYGLETIGLRYFNVFGRRQDPKGAYAAVIPRWIDAIASCSDCQVFGDGSQSRDFCYIDNVVQANLLAAASSDASSTNQVYNVGCNGNTTLLALFDKLKQSVAEQIPAAASVKAIHVDPRPGDVQHSQASVDKAIQCLGYAPGIDVDEGLAKTVRWFLSNLKA